MVVKTEGQHTGEFLVSEGNGSISRDEGVLKAGETVKDGDVLGYDSGKLVKLAKTTGIVSTDVAGIAYGDAKAGVSDGVVVVISRLAEVDKDLIHYANGTNVSQLTAALEARFIIPR